MKILLVDDDPEILLNLSNFLSQLGYDVSTCDRSTDVTAMLERNPAHLVLSDINMPGLNGYDLLRKLKASDRWRDVIVILFTGFGDIRGAVQAMKEGAWDYLLKPIDVAELKLILERAEEYVVLRREHRELSERFDARVEESISDWRLRYDNLLQAFTKVAGLDGIGIFDPAMRRVFEIADRFHEDSSVPVLIEGETGTGKEVLAKYIHYGPRATPTPLVDLNCASIPPTLFESELFGYEAGAYTGGNPKGQAGKIEQAEGGTLFLDEIGELPMEYQAKLLRLVQERTFYRVGGLKKLHTNARIICATNQNLEEKISQGVWRRDLYYRLQVGLLRIPPLRQRRKEISPLAELFLQQACDSRGKPRRSLSPEARQILMDNAWPGNVRELKNTIERMVILYDDDTISAGMVRAVLSFAGNQPELHNGNHQAGGIFIRPDRTLRDYTLEVVRQTLEANRWNKARTARQLGISRATLYTYIEEIGAP